jgi:5-methylcytosine-specific restriction endonuclease McrA
MPARRVTINGRDQIDPRHTRAWRKLRDQVVEQEPTCQLRFRGICTSTSTTAAHVKPVTTHPELALERTNLVGACTACNEASGTLPRESLVTGTADDVDRPALAVFRWPQKSSPSR